MSDVAKKLAAATCEAAPYGWRPTTLGDREIIEFYDDEFGGFVGIVRTENCGLAAVQWEDCGVDDDDAGGPWNLVPLPAPEPERLTDEQLDRAWMFFNPQSDGGKMASELQQARKTIAEQADALAAKDGEADRHAQATIIDQRRRLAEYDQGCREQSDTIQRLANERDELSRCVDLQRDEIDRCTRLMHTIDQETTRKIAEQAAEIANLESCLKATEANCESHGNKFRELMYATGFGSFEMAMEWIKAAREQAAEIERLTQAGDEMADQRDAAIELARRLAHSERFIDYADAVEEFDKRYCDHEWYGDEDLPLTEKACAKCGAIGKACPDCGGVCLDGCGCDDSGLVVVPTCEPLPPANEAPEIEYVRIKGHPQIVYIPETINRTKDGKVVNVVCGPVIVSGDLESLVGGVWRAI